MLSIITRHAKNSPPPKKKRILLIFNNYTQTDRMSAYVVGCIKILLTSSLLTMQILVVVCHTVCVHEGGLRNLGRCWGSAP